VEIRKGKLKEKKLGKFASEVNGLGYISSPDTRKDKKHLGREGGKGELGEGREPREKVPKNQNGGVDQLKQRGISDRASITPKGGGERSEKKQWGGSEPKKGTHIGRNLLILLQRWGGKIERKT